MVDPTDLPAHMRACPIETAIRYVGKKWAVNIVRDLFLGHNRFSQFLRANPGLSTKMLSARLRELERDGFISKKKTDRTPSSVQYGLTERGLALNGILLELSVFSFRYCSNEVYKRPWMSIEQDIQMMRKVLRKAEK